MRHGGLASALALAVGGLAGAQSPPLTPYNPLPPTVISGTVRAEPVPVTGSPAAGQADNPTGTGNARSATTSTAGTPAVTTSPNASPACPVTTLPPTGLGGPSPISYARGAPGGGEFWASVEYLRWRIREDTVP